MVATLSNPVAPATAQLLPELYQPVLVWVTPLALRLRGFERCEDSQGSFSVVQEWHGKYLEPSSVLNSSSELLCLAPLSTCAF